MKWDTIKLGDVMDVKHGFPFESQFFADSGDYILLSPGNCNESGGLKLKGDREKYYTGEFPPDFLLNEGDMLVVMTDLINSAPILGGSFIIPESNRFLHNQRLGLVRITDERRIDKRFLFYLLNTHGYRGQVRGSASGATVRHTSPSRIRACSVCVPRDVNHQREIGAALFAYDDLIENNRRRMALLEEAARQLYREWFVRLRFPGHERVKIKDGLPEGWERKALAAVAEVNRASLPSSFNGEVEYIDIASVSPGSIDSTTRYDFLDAPSRARRMVAHGDIIWSCVRPNRRSYAVIWQPRENLVASTGFAVLTPRTLPTSYLLQATTTDAFVGYLNNHARGAAYPAVLASDFERSEILVPRSRVVEAYDEVAEPILAQTHALRSQNQMLRAARDLLLPKLMSGEIAV